MLSCPHVTPSLLILPNRHLQCADQCQLLLLLLGISLLIHPDRHLLQCPDLCQLSIFVLQILINRFLSQRADWHQLSITIRFAVLRHLPQHLLFHPVSRLSVARHQNRYLFQQLLPRLGGLAVLRRMLAFQHGSQTYHSHGPYQLP
jgi:hypothetical protein